MTSRQITDDDLILVTGASGFIATHIVKQLLEKGYRVRGTVRSLKNEKKVAPLRRLAKNSRFELELVEADLLNEESWINAVKGCTYVLHTASPVVLETPKDENELIKPALDGTLSVFRACVQPGSRVKRVVLTSSALAIAGEKIINGYTYTEKDWPKLETLNGYHKSKYLAEKAAWDFVKERNENGLFCFELAVINPGMILGPMLHDSDVTTLEFVKRIMLGELPLVPDISFPMADVRDVAEAHERAMTLNEAVNNRHIIVTTKESQSLMSFAQILQEEFKPKNYKISTCKSPNIVLKVGSLFDKSIATILPLVGIRAYYDNTRMVSVLGVRPTDVRTTLIDTAYSLIDKNVVPKKF